MTADAKKADSPRGKSSARLFAVQAVYQMLISGQKAAQIIDDFSVFRIDGAEPELQGIAPPQRELLSAIVQGVENELAVLREDIEKTLKDGQTIDSLQEKEPLLLAILLCGVYEIKSHTSIDVPIIMSDYLNVTHSYYQGHESSIINGILDAVKVIYR
jgi:transcription antitermination protein NusB